MEAEKKLKQFTFYELYADIIEGLDDSSAGKFINRICQFEFDNVQAYEEMTDKEQFYWSNVVETLEEVKAIELAGKLPKRYNYKAKHYTFIDMYYKAIKLLNVKQAGVFIKGINEYMFKDIVPAFTDKSIQGYFNLCKVKLDLSKKRKSVGKAGDAKRKKKKEETVNVEEEIVEGMPSIEEEIIQETPDVEDASPAIEEKKVMTYREFRDKHPNVKGELYDGAKRYETSLDWAEVDETMETDLSLRSQTHIYYLAMRYAEKYGEKTEANE